MFRGVIIAIALSLSASANDYVDPARCAGCHREIAANYERTGMAKSFYKPSPAKTIEDYANNREYYHALSDSHYSMTIRNGQYFQRRWQLGPDGKEINVEELKIDYVIGSGNHGRFYLHRTGRDMLIELPLGWYPQKGGEWGLVPGSDLPQPRTRRFIPYKCMFCHNAYPNIPAGNEALESDPVYPAELNQGIDCQRCHGPGGDHVRSFGRTGIVNPAKLSPTRRMEVCLQCHLETTGGKIPGTLQRFDRGIFSFIPGQPLTDYAIFFDYAPGSGRENRFEGVSGAYRFLQSRCFLESGGKLECVTCHDPHNVPRGPDAIRHYSAVCRECHQSAHPASVKVTADDCVTCHMPKRRPDDSPHMIFTDHLIQRRAPANALAEFPERPPEEYRGAVVPFYPSPLPETPLNSLYKAVAQVGLGNNVAAGLPDLARLIDEVNPPEPEFYSVLGDGWKNAGEKQKSAEAYRRALQIRPDLAGVMRSLAAVQDPIAAEATLARAIEIAPGDPENWFRLGVLQSSPEKIQKAIALDPLLPDQQRRLAESLAKAGQWDRAEAALTAALRTDPFDDEAWDLGGRILSEKGNLPDAFFDFQRAIKIRPAAGYMYDYALALVRADRFDDAQNQSQMAIRADGNLAEAHELLGALHLRKKELPDAEREYLSVVALKPDLARAQLRLGSILAEEGKREGAASHLRSAANGNDAIIARQAQQALLDMGFR